MNTEFNIGDRVECDYYSDKPALKGTVIKFKHNGFLICVKLDIGSYIETYPPLIRHI